MKKIIIAGCFLLMACSENPVEIKQKAFCKLDTVPTKNNVECDSIRYFLIGYWYKKYDGITGNGSYQISHTVLPNYKTLTCNICKMVGAEKAIVLSVYEFKNKFDYDTFNP